MMCRGQASQLRAVGRPAEGPPAGRQRLVGETRPAVVVKDAAAVGSARRSSGRLAGTSWRGRGAARCGAGGGKHLATTHLSFLSEGSRLYRQLRWQKWRIFSRFARSPRFSHTFAHARTQKFKKFYHFSQILRICRSFANFY